MFSSPYYSHLSLLPWDPPPFTLPDTSESPDRTFYLTKSHKPTITLSSYPLPNGDWKWVSKSWMIDMRGDGQVQYDGFEYNWLFRKHKWSATSAAWVRRRRWIRLMMRPAKQRLHPSTTAHISSSASPSPSVGVPASQSTRPSPALSNGRSRHSWRSGIQSRPPSVLSPRSTTSSIVPGFIWQGDGVDDWERCHDYLRSLTRDGKKLEVWNFWLGLSGVVESEGVENTNKKQWSEDEGLLPSQALAKTPKNADVSTVPPREWIVAAIREHVSIFPRSNPFFLNPGSFADGRNPANLCVPRLPSSVRQRTPQDPRRVGRRCRAVPQFVSVGVLELHFSEPWRIGLVCFHIREGGEAERTASRGPRYGWFTLKYRLLPLLCC